MIKQKPVWRVAYGKLPSNINNVAYIYQGDIYKGHVVKGWPCAQDPYHAGRSSGTFYDTNRTKEAKYERVECPICGGRSFIKQCVKCNHKGYLLEAINHAS